jgi:hypothetical protein
MNRIRTQARHPLKRISFFLLVALLYPLAAGAGRTASSVEPLGVTKIFTSDSSGSLKTNFNGGDDIRYNVTFTVPGRRAYVFANGRVVGEGWEDILEPQVGRFPQGTHTLFWDETIPLGASGDAALSVLYVGILDEITKERFRFTVGGNGSAQPASDFVGSNVCRACHEFRTDPDDCVAGAGNCTYNTYITTGHPFILNATDGRAPAYPFSEVPDPPPGLSWDDISFVAGGHGWSANFLDQNGFIITGDATQYNLETEEFVPFMSGETAAYDCGRCHTTGYSEGGNQGGLPGIEGTWVEEGVTCEACHGPGATHVRTQSSDDILVTTAKELCGRCHSGKVEGKVEAEDGLIAHEDQFDELMASPKSFLDCADCHNPHESAKFAPEEAIIVDCINCHPTQTIGVPSMVFLDCEDCHMPFAVKSAVTEDEGASLEGDVHSHLFKIDPSKDPSEMFFQENGQTFSKGFLTVNFACLGCHDGRTASLHDVEWARQTATLIHP